MNGGPGCSSLIGAFAENGPLNFIDNTTNLASNPHAWSQLGHVLYIDQPVGTGFSPTTASEPVSDIDKITTDFYAWLKSFYEHFPHLSKKKLYMTGESYAGIFIPYFASEIMRNHDSFPLDLVSISLGDGVFGNNAAMSDVMAGSIMKSFAPSLGTPDDILDAFSAADRICGFDSVSEAANQYPPRGPINIPGNPENLNFKRDDSDSLFRRDLISMGKCNIKPTTPSAISASILNSTCYGPCATYATAADYLNTLFNKPPESCHSPYNIKYNCSSIDPNPIIFEYFNRPDVQDALHIPDSIRRDNNTYLFQPCNQEIINSLYTLANTPTPPAYTIIPDLLSIHNISVNIYQGGLDFRVNHLGVELVLQNMTWNGAQGFQKRPTKLFDAELRHQEEGGNGSAGDSEPIGVWTEERGLSYHLFSSGGHVLPLDQPRAMFNYVKEVVVGG